MSSRLRESKERLASFVLPPLASENCLRSAASIQEVGPFTSDCGPSSWTIPSDRDRAQLNETTRKTSLFGLGRVGYDTAGPMEIGPSHGVDDLGGQG